ncbi:phytanoyl-CoA dioxygenase family protein [Streptomyces sp. NPDC005840]|uniref:phytanoyl-CoA dioxygenase family protein n=1 Tax=Streptomyces sp. NPDC005840 TaxID=3157072 RepID=UPI0034074874
MIAPHQKGRLVVVQNVTEENLQAHVDRFTAQGFTVMRGVFTADEVARMRAASERVVSKVRADPMSFDAPTVPRFTDRTEGALDTWGVDNMFAPRLYEADLGAIFGHERFMEFSHAVLGPNLRFWAAHLLWSPERTSYELGWHKDQHDNEQYDPTGRSLHVQFNVCLTEDTSFRAVPGSHRRPLTDAERAAVTTDSSRPLDGEVRVECEAGDVIYMNHHMVHRGSCEPSRFRRTLHMNVQSMEEQTGGQTSYSYMRELGYLESVDPALAALMRKAIEWDDAHPVDRAEARRRMRISHDLRRSTAGAAGTGK